MATTVATPSKWPGRAAPSSGSATAQTLTVVLGNQPIKVEALNLELLTKGGPRRWPQTIQTTVAPGESMDGYAFDELIVPLANPWGSWMRTTALDFFNDGRMAVSTMPVSTAQ